MYLSQLLVNIGSDPDKPRPGLEWIKQTYRVHQRIWMAFPDDKSREEDPFFLGEWSPDAKPKPKRSEAGFLYRIEPDHPTRILVQSVLKPDWEYAFQNARHLIAAPPLVREFEPVFQSGQSYRVRLAMLMVRRRAGRRLGVGTEATPQAGSEMPIRCFLPLESTGGQPKPDPNFTAWRDRLAIAAESHGFTVMDVGQKAHVQPINNLRMKTNGRAVGPPFSAALFDGVLTCTHPDLLRNAVINGIGRGKAFGMGLLSLAVVR